MNTQTILIGHVTDLFKQADNFLNRYDDTKALTEMAKGINFLEAVVKKSEQDLYSEALESAALKLVQLAQRFKDSATYSHMVPGLHIKIINVAIHYLMIARQTAISYGYAIEAERLLALAYSFSTDDMQSIDMPFFDYSFSKLHCNVELAQKAFAQFDYVAYRNNPAYQFEAA
jgi:hypothetical protein